MPRLIPSNFIFLSNFFVKSYGYLKFNYPNNH